MTRLSTYQLLAHTATWDYDEERQISVLRVVEQKGTDEAAHLLHHEIIRDNPLSTQIGQRLLDLVLRLIPKATSRTVALYAMEN